MNKYNTYEIDMEYAEAESPSFDKEASYNLRSSEIEESEWINKIYTSETHDNHVLQNKGKLMSYR